VLVLRVIEGEETKEFKQVQLVGDRGFLFQHIKNSKLTVVVVFQQVSHSSEQVKKVDVHEAGVAVNFATFCTKQVVNNKYCANVNFRAPVFRKTNKTTHELVDASANLSIIVVV
jgi:hypothetical protein